MIDGPDVVKSKTAKSDAASGKPKSRSATSTMNIAQLKSTAATKRKKLKLRYSNILRAAKDWFSKDPMNTKDGDKITAGTITINNISDFVKSLFGQIEFDPSDITRLDSSSYENLATTVGLLFREHGGNFDQKN